MIRRLVSMLAGRSLRARQLVVALMALIALNIVASALTSSSGPRRPSRETRAPAATTPGARAQRPPTHLGPVQLARVRATANRFLEGYLRFAYGRGPARSAEPVTPALRRQLIQERALATPAEGGRHPRAISVEAVGRGPGVALAAALVDDGGITTYALRIMLRKGRSGWQVSGVEGG